MPAVDTLETPAASRRSGLFSKPAALRAELERAFPERPFAVRFWDGSKVEATAAGPTFLVNSPAAIAHLLRAPGELGLARAYVQGLLDVDDIDGAIGVVEHWRPPQLPPRRWLGLATAAVRAMGLVRPPRVPEIELRLRGRRHSVRRDREAIRYHYDAGNEFFALFLDPSMTYSCAIFSRGAETLEGRLSVSALAREHPISVTAMQKHVAVLERAELVSKHRVGRESIVRTRADALARARAALDRLEADWRGRIERMDQILDTDKGDT